MTNLPRLGTCKKQACKATALTGVGLHLEAGAALAKGQRVAGAAGHAATLHRNTREAQCARWAGSGVQGSSMAGVGQGMQPVHSCSRCPSTMSCSELQAPGSCARRTHLAAGEEEEAAHEQQGECQVAQQVEEHGAAVLRVAVRRKVHALVAAGRLEGWTTAGLVVVHMRLLGLLDQHS